MGGQISVKLIGMEVGLGQGQVPKIVSSMPQLDFCDHKIIQMTSTTEIHTDTRKLTINILFCCHL